ncbi:hypothetical protein [Brevundimonas sp.]
MFGRSKPIDPLAVLHGALDALELNAIARGETQAIHALREARKTVTREALKPQPIHGAAA